MKVLFALILGIALGAVGIWMFTTERGKAHMLETQKQLEEVTREAREAAQEQAKAWNLDPASVKEELGRSGQVIRRKALQAGEAIADATADARITATIKAKLLREPDLSALSVSVNTTQGIVTLSGAVSSPEDISKAMRLAMETERVREVMSTLQLKAKPKAEAPAKK